MITGESDVKAGMIGKEQVVMSEDLEPLVLDLVEWVARAPRPYAEMLDAWRTSCPRLPVWEEACDRGLVTRRSAPDGGALVMVTADGRRYLHQHRRPCGVEPAGKAAGR
jgi:hypothetical protein